MQPHKLIRYVTITLVLFYFSTSHGFLDTCPRSTAMEKCSSNDDDDNKYFRTERRVINVSQRDRNNNRIFVDRQTGSRSFWRDHDGDLTRETAMTRSAGNPMQKPNIRNARYDQPRLSQNEERHFVQLPNFRNQQSDRRRLERIEERISNNQRRISTEQSIGRRLSVDYSKSRREQPSPYTSSRREERLLFINNNPQSSIHHDRKTERAGDHQRRESSYKATGSRLSEDYLKTRRELPSSNTRRDVVSSTSRREVIRQDRKAEERINTLSTERHERVKDHERRDVINETTGRLLPDEYSKTKLSSNTRRDVVSSTSRREGILLDQSLNRKFEGRTDRRSLRLEDRQRRESSYERRQSRETSTGKRLSEDYSKFRRELPSTNNRRDGVSSTSRREVIRQNHKSDERINIPSTERRQRVEGRVMDHESAYETAQRRLPQEHSKTRRELLYSNTRRGVASSTSRREGILQDQSMNRKSEEKVGSRSLEQVGDRQKQAREISIGRRLSEDYFKPRRELHSTNLRRNVVSSSSKQEGTHQNRKSEERSDFTSLERRERQERIQSRQPSIGRRFPENSRCELPSLDAHRDAISSSSRRQERRELAASSRFSKQQILTLNSSGRRNFVSSHSRRERELLTPSDAVSSGFMHFSGSSLVSDGFGRLAVDSSSSRRERKNSSMRHRESALPEARRNALSYNSKHERELASRKRNAISSNSRRERDLLIPSSDISRDSVSSRFMQSSASSRRSSRASDGFGRRVVDSSSFRREEKVSSLRQRESALPEARRNVLSSSFRREREFVSVDLRRRDADFSNSRRERELLIPLSNINRDSRFMQSSKRSSFASDRFGRHAVDSSSVRRKVRTWSMRFAFPEARRNVLSSSSRREREFASLILSRNAVSSRRRDMNTRNSESSLSDARYSFQRGMRSVPSSSLRTSSIRRSGEERRQIRLVQTAARRVDISSALRRAERTPSVQLSRRQGQQIIGEDRSMRKSERRQAPVSREFKIGETRMQTTTKRMSIIEDQRRNSRTSFPERVTLLLTDEFPSKHAQIMSEGGQDWSKLAKTLLVALTLFQILAKTYPKKIRFNNLLHGFSAFAKQKMQ